MRTVVVVMGFGLWVTGCQLLEAQVGRQELVNAKVRMALDGEGRIVELTNRQTGSRYVESGGRAPWRMYYRLGGPLDGALDLEIEPDAQKGLVKREGNSLVLSYETLKANLPRQGQTRDLRVRLALRVTLEDDRLVWTARIENSEKDARLEVTEIWLPWIYGIGDMGMGREADVLYWPEFAGRRITAPYTKLAAARSGRGSPGYGYAGISGPPSLRLIYPWPAGMQWFTFNNGEEGLYFGSHDKTLMTTCLNVMAEPDNAMSASIVKYPFVKAGETWTSEQVVMRLYRGDWHEAARTYRAWADPWIERPKPPEWLRRAPGWVLTSPKGQTGHISSVYADLPATLKEAQSVGIDLLMVFGWAKQGFDNLYPEYTVDEAMGGASGLKEALAQVRRAGGRTILYTQGQLIDPATEFYRTKGHRMVAKDIWGYEYRETYGGGGRGTLLNMTRNKYFGVACPSAPGWVNQLISQFEMVKGFGAQGIIFDQLGGHFPYVCFSNEHGHSKPSLAAGLPKVWNNRRLREVIKASDPEFIFVVELAEDCYTSSVDITHAWGTGFWPEPEGFGEMFRYTFPEPIVTNRSGGPYDRRRQLGHAFTLGWRFDANVRDIRDPAIARYLARLCQLRKAHPELLLEGRFVDNEGFMCDNSNVSAHAFLAGDRMAVVLWNSTEVPQKARVVAEGYTLESAEWQDPGWSGTDHSTMPSDVAVLVFRRR